MEGEGFEAIEGDGINHPAIYADLLASLDKTNDHSVVNRTGGACKTAE